MSNPPNQTLYVSNLNESVNKQELRRSLYSLCSQFGRIMDVVALKTRKMRGQAFVVFTDIDSATQAKRTLNAFQFYGRPLRCDYARGKSHAVMKEDGTFGQPEKKEAKPKAPKAPKADKPKAIAAAAEGEMDTSDAPEPVKPVVQENPPNSILFLSNLPDETTDTMIEMLFQQLDGFKEVRQVDGRPDIAFVEYESEDQAANAKDTLHNFKITPQNFMAIAFAKK